MMQGQKENTSTEQRVSSDGLYLYCFARSGLLLHAEIGGIDGRGGITTLEAGDVAAVYSRVSLDEFTGEAGERNLEDPQWVVPRAYRHEQVIEEVMRLSPVLPVRFGAVFSSGQALAQVLTDHSEEISLFLDSISDKEEWSVKGFMDFEKAAERLLETEPVFTERRRHLPDLPGARYLQEKRLRTEARKQAKHRSHSAAEQLLKELEELGLDACTLKLQAKAMTGRDEEMVLNCAFLLPRERVAEIRGRVKRIGSKYAEEGVDLTVSGPWPPYNFCPAVGKPVE